MLLNKNVFFHPMVLFFHHASSIFFLLFFFLKIAVRGLQHPKDYSSQSLCIATFHLFVCCLQIRNKKGHFL